MDVVLSSTWHPRGEWPRLERLADRLGALFGSVVVVLPPGYDDQAGKLARLANWHVVRSDAAMWRSGRHVALREALPLPGDVLFACDMDRLLHWLEAHPDELTATVTNIHADCHIYGRTAAAWATHPQAMVETEALFNRVFSRMFGVTGWDFGAGCKAFSRAAAEHVLAHVPTDSTFAIDAGWPLLLDRAGFRLAYREVDGLAWETPDQGLPTIASAAARQTAAQQADTDPAFWQRRVWVADQILRAGLVVADYLADQ